MKPRYQVPVTLTKGSKVLHFDNCKEASESFGVANNTITRALNNGKTYKGYTIRRNI